MYFSITSLSSKGQIVIPADIRKQLGLTPGRKIGIMHDGKHILLQPLTHPSTKPFKKLIDTAVSLKKKGKA